MKAYLLLLPIFILSLSVSAQKRVLESNHNYSTAKIVITGKGVIPVKNMMLVNDTLLQYNSQKSDGSSYLKQVSTSTIRYVKIKQGSYAGIGAAAGAGTGLLSAVYGILTVKSDPTLDDSDVNWTPFVLGFTAGGALIGSMVGLCIPKWRTYFLPDSKTSSSIKFTPVMSPAYCGIGIKMKL